jgi:threonine dehydrogenase-like Zn-dependent dehydrogenase
MQRGLDVHVLDPIDSGFKPDLVRALGASYHAGMVAGVGFKPDIIIECTGAGSIISDSIQEVATGGIICLTGIGSGDRSTGAVTGDIAAKAVLKNKVVVGSVNANERHWYKAGEALARADRSWLYRLITRRERALRTLQEPSRGRMTISRSSSNSPKCREKHHRRLRIYPDHVVS